MRFKHRIEKMTYVVRPATQILTDRGKLVATKPLRVKFENHEWDSEEAMVRERWTNEERLEVEEYLQKHFDFGRQWQGGYGGLYLADGPTVPVNTPDLTTQGQQLVVRCSWTDEINGVPEPCDKVAEVSTDEGMHYCEEHAKLAGAKQKVTRGKKAVGV